MVQEQLILALSTEGQAIEAKRLEKTETALATEIKLTAKTKEKIEIAKNYLLPELLSTFMFDEKDIILNDSIIEYIINNHTDKEEGVRNLKRCIESIISKINIHILSDGDDDLSFTLKDFKLPDNINSDDNMVKIINKLIGIANEERLQALVLTFFPHPRTIVQEDASIKLINTIDEKAGLMKSYGVDHLVVKEFTKEFSRLTALEYVRDVLVNKLHVKHIIVIILVQVIL